MALCEVDGHVLDSFNVAFHATKPTPETHEAVCAEVNRILEDKLTKLIQPNQMYAVTVIITKLEIENVISQRQERQNQEGFLSECRA